MEISKLDAAKRQLEFAIKLFFKEADPVSIHTLTAAAHQLLMDLSKLEGIKSIVKDPIFIREESRKEYLKIINEAENFFKHAEKDPQALLKFNPEESEFLLLDAVEMYMQLTHESPEDMSIYRVWFLLKYPDIISEETHNKLKTVRSDYLVCFQKKTKLDFYMTLKDALMHSKF